MQKLILENLKKIEVERECKILFAIESGSRVWGFPSINSDYDARFVYIKKPEHYLSIDEKRDVIEVPIDGDLDINGWDIRKACRLFRKFNPTLMEWLVSDIVYMDDFGFRQELLKLAPDAFSLSAVVFHYMNMAKSNFREYLQGNEVRTKKYFYVLRPIFAAEWAIRHVGIPPIKFQDTMNEISIANNVRNEIDKLLEIKMSGVELGTGSRNDILNSFIQQKLEEITGIVNNHKLDDKKVDITPELDNIFRNYLNRAWSIN